MSIVSPVVRSERTAGAAQRPPPTPVWPPQSPNALYLHTGMEHTTDGTFTVIEQDGSEGPTRDIVTSITFANGITMVATGTGVPVTIDADGLHFEEGKYLSLPLGATFPYSGIAAFARVTRRVNGATATQQQVIGVNSATVDYLLAFNTSNRRLVSDLGDVNITNLQPEFELGPWNRETEYVFGIEHDAEQAGRDIYGSSTIWLNKRVIRTLNLPESIPVDEWVVGKDFFGTIHEGVAFFRREGDTHSLFPPGGSSQWAMNCLA